MVLNGVPEGHPMFSLVSHSHVYRESNIVVDLLASYALSSSLGLHVFSSPPEGCVIAFCWMILLVFHCFLVF